MDYINFGYDMKCVTRIFTQTEPRASDATFVPEGEISTFFHHCIFVVLGEPGLGKTTSFQQAVKEEDKAEFVRIGEFLSAPNLDNFIGKTLYLDGLDEHRSRANGVDVMDALIGRLKTLECPKVRISCRTAEWHGGTDLNALSAVSNDTPIAQLELRPLDPEQILQIIPDSDEFIDGARKNGLEEFLSNPQDIHLLHEFYSVKNSWPHNRSEMMEGACKALVKELNPAHSEAIDDWVTDRDLERASNYLASVLMLSNISGISSTQSDANMSFPCIQSFDGDLFAMKAATGRRVFKFAGKNKIEPKHRKIAEYMSGRYLAARVREGLSLRRVMALLTGMDGATPSDLRGVYAWLISLLSGMADQVLVHDPYGAIIYGDAYSWTPSTKRSALIALQTVAIKNPWFRGHDRSRHALGGLSDPALVSDFQKILLEDKCESHLIGIVLDAIAGGRKLPDMGDTLLDFALDPEKPEHLKDDAIDAFANSCPDRMEDLVGVLNKIQAGEIEDEDQYLRGALLNNLYPDVVGPEEIVSFLVKPSNGVIGWYHMFFRHRIFEMTDIGGLKLIADSLHENQEPFLDADEYDYRSFIGTLVSQLIEIHGKEATVEELYSWLELAIRKHGSSEIRGDDATRIQNFFLNHPEVYTSLFFYWFLTSWNDKWDGHEIRWRYSEFTVQVAPPREFAPELIRRIRDQGQHTTSNALFELACIIVINDDPDRSLVTLDDLWDIAKDHPVYTQIVERTSKVDWEKWRKQDVTRRIERLAERETRQAKNIETLTPHIDKIESGEDLGQLEYYARIWFKLFTDVDHDVSPKERLRQEVGKDLAEIFEKGFVNALNKKNFNTIEDIAKADTKQRAYHRGYVMLAAFDILLEKDENEILDLPDEILCLALAYNFANTVERETTWPNLLLDQKTALYEDFLGKYWRFQLANGAESLSNLYSFSGDEPLLPVMVQLLPSLLSEYPKAHLALLQCMMVNSIRFCRPRDLVTVVEKALKLRFHVVGQRAMWIAMGVTLDQEKYVNLLKIRMRTNHQDKWAVRSILMADISKRKTGGKLSSSIKYRVLVIELLGAVFRNVHFITRGGASFVPEQDDPTVADEIRKLIHSFEHEVSDEAAEALSSLKKNYVLSHWHTDILYAIANQVRVSREARFTYADVSQVLSTLSNAEPANVADLKALVMDVLKEITDEIRHGNTDGYKSFWNTDSYGNATNDHVNENTARDRLLELIRPKLRHLDIAAEPEVRYADDKRADIAIYCRGMKLPIEIKRDDHSELWNAAEDQLKKQYSRDPASEGNGIYLVFWFDGLKMKKRPGGGEMPTNSEQLEGALESTIPESSKGLINVFVIDASVPPEKRTGASKKKTKKKVRRK